MSGQDSLAKYAANRTGVKRGLRAHRRTQLQAAAAIGRSTTLVSRVLSGHIKSKRCLVLLAAWLNVGAPLAATTRAPEPAAVAEAAGC